MCPDWGWNPQHFGVWDGTLTNLATLPGLFSPLVINIVLEVLAIQVGNEEVKLSLFADDKILCIDNLKILPKN